MTFDPDNLFLPPTDPVPVPALHTEFPSVIDNTAREQYFTCPRKFQLSSINHIQPARKSIHLHAGGAYASGLEVMRKSFYDLGKDPETSLENGIEAALIFYGDYVPLENELKTPDRIVKALVSYAEQYPLETDAVRPYQFKPDRHAIEFTFAIPLPINHPVTGEPILYAGRFDMLGVFNNTLFVVDDKTTSRLGSTWSKQWELNSQFTGYIWAAQQFDLPVAGAIIRGQSILKHGSEHAQAITYRPKWMIDRWFDQLLHDISGMIDSWKANRFSFAIGGACTSYGSCEFHRLCQTEHPSEHIAGDFVQRHWNPLAKDPEAPEEK